MRLAILFSLLSTISVWAAAQWPGVPYSEVRAFAWDASLSTDELIHADMSFADGVINKEGTPLSEAQVKRLLQAEARRLNQGRTPGCYFPHNAFVFYNAQHKPVAFLEICFDCTVSREYPQDDGADANLVALAMLCDELKLPFGMCKTVEEYRKKRAWILPPDMLQGNPK